jgi:hypothetical protein
VRPTTALEQTPKVDESKSSLPAPSILVQSDKVLPPSIVQSKDSQSTPSPVPASHTLLSATPPTGNTIDASKPTAASSASAKQRKVVIDLPGKPPATSLDTCVPAKPSDPIPVTLSASIVLEQSEKLLKKLLKVLHVCARYQRCTGKQLPDTIDFFGKTLLGMTSIR